MKKNSSDCKMNNDLIRNVDEVIKKLQKSPLFYLFSASREVFHSNFWEWLYNVNRLETIKLLTGKKQPIDSDLFKREDRIGTKCKVDIAI